MVKETKRSDTLKTGALVSTTKFESHHPALTIPSSPMVSNMAARGVIASCSVSSKEKGK